jgi:glycosyltransferase involved in cell wall biosynthesis
MRLLASGGVPPGEHAAVEPVEVDRRGKHIAMVVANGVTGDSRVQKTARSAREAGYDVTVIGMAKTGERSIETLDGVRVVRVAVDYARTGAVKRKWKTKEQSRAVAQRARKFVNLEMRERRARVTRAQARLDSLLAMGAGRRECLPFRAFIRADEVTILAGKAALMGIERAAERERRSVELEEPVDSAERERKVFRAELSDIGSAFLAELESTEFDLIHAHDFMMIECARRAADKAATGRARRPFVYDAHEWVRGLTYLPPGRRDVVLDAEARNIGAADAVVTVSPILANRLRDEHSLDETPQVVLNAPVARAFNRSSGHSVRAQTGLPDDIPLAVYSGGVHESRGVATLIQSLPLVSELHLAIVASNPDLPGVVSLLAEAERLGCNDRVHVVPFVAPDEVSSYLRTANVGVHPLLRSGNAELALPNKLFEYLHAGLPMVVSDMPSMADMVRRHGWGEVFSVGEPQSLAEAVRRVLAQTSSYDVALKDAQVRERFSWERQADTLVRTYDHLIAKAADDGALAASPRR